MMSESRQEKIKIGISGCLLGEEVRFDGGHKHNGYITGTLSQFFDFESFCPEVAIGLGIPRKTIKLISRENEIRCVSSTDESVDYTEQLTEVAKDKEQWHQGLCGYILKNRSPSCGMERVKVFDNGHPANKGVGIYALEMMRNAPDMPVEEEGRLEDPILRENFIKRVIVYHRWKVLLEEGLNLESLHSFHAQHKLVFMSHDQNLCRQLGKELSFVKKDDVKSFVPEYASSAMEILKIRATISNHVNVLQHIQGYLKSHLDKGDKQELSETIEDYRLGNVPLIVPITLFRHFFRLYPNEYIEDSVYMNPHPKELMLLNSL